METKTCPNCGWRKDIGAEVCHCGYEFPQDTIPSKPIEPSTDVDQTSIEQLPKLDDWKKADFPSDKFDDSYNQETEAKVPKNLQGWWKKYIILAFLWLALILWGIFVGDRSNFSNHMDYESASWTFFFLGVPSGMICALVTLLMVVNDIVKRVKP